MPTPRPIIDPFDGGCSRLCRRRPTTRGGDGSEGDAARADLLGVSERRIDALDAWQALHLVEDRRVATDHPVTSCSRQCEH